MIKRSTKYIIYSIILLLVLTLSVGFSAFQKQLLIDDSIFNVRLQVDTRVSGKTIQKTSGNAISNSEDYNVKKIYGNVTFPTTSSYVLYKVDLTNYGNVKTGLLNITSNTSGINYSICDSNGNNCTNDPKTSVCNGSNCTLGSTKTIYVKVTSTSTGTKNVDLDLEFAPIHTVTYENFRESTTSFKTDIMEGETYEVTLSSSPEEVSGVNATANYNSSNNKLTITNVTNDATITAKYLFTDVAETSYTGSNPNNYVRFNNTLFRIITKETIDDGYGNSDLRGKIIANTSIGNYQFDASSNDFGVSSLTNTLNTTYYNGLNETSQRLIGTALWTEDYADYIGLIKSSDFTTNSSWLTNTQYTLTPGTESNITAIISGSLTNSAVTVSRATYPVMYLSEKVLIIGGSGTSTDPYLLGLSDNGDIPNPTKIDGRSLTVNGSAQELVTVTNKLGTPYYSTTTVLNSSNYTSGSTSIPTVSSAGNYTIYYYIPPMEGIKAKQGTAHTTISGITYTINYSKGDHVSSIGKTSDTCTTTGSNTTCSVTLPSITPTSGWTNGLWSYGSNTYNPGASFTLNSSNNNGTLTANANTMTYTVAFNANGGTGGQSASVTAINGEPMPTISTTAPTMEGYTFMGWYDNQVYTSGTQYYTAAGASARNYDKTGGTTLYAGWRLNLPERPTISGGGEAIFGGSKQLTCSTTTTYASGTTLYYSFGYAPSRVDPASNWTTPNESPTYDAPSNNTERYYSCRVYATNTTLSQTSSTASSVNSTSVWFVRARIDFDATTNGGTISGTTPLYIEYNGDTFVTNRNSSGGVSIVNSPIARKESWTFDGWYTTATGGSKVIASDGTIQSGVANWTNADGQFIVVNTSNNQNTNRLYAQFIGNTYTATFYYNSSATSGNVSPATVTTQCTVTVGSSCTVDVPEEVTNSVGQYNSPYYGVAGINTMTNKSLTISADTTYYAIYSSPIIIYYPNSSNEIISTNTALYRNEYFRTTNGVYMNTVTAVSQSSKTQATSVTLSNVKGSFQGLETAVNTYSNKYALNNTTNVLNTNRTTYYAVVTASENAVIHYNSNTTSGSFTNNSANAATTSTYYCSSTSAIGTVHGTTTTVPSAVSSSVGKYNSAYKGISSSSTDITNVTTFTGGSTYYAYYSSPLTIYYPNTSNGVSSSNTSLYRNEYYSSTTAMTTKTATSQTSTTQATSITLSNLKGTLSGITSTVSSTTSYAVNNTTNVINKNTTTYYAVTTGSETVTFRYNNNTTCGSTTLANNTSTTVTSTYYCSSTSAMGTSHGTTTTVPTAVSNSKGQYNSNYRAVANINSLTPVTTFTGGSTYYAIYSSSVTNYYYSSSYTNRTVYRNEYLASASATSYTSVIATANNSTSNYTTSGGPGSSAWVGLADSNTATVKYSSVANAATSNTCTTTLYSIYQFSINYEKGSNVSAIGKTSDVCNINHNTTSCTVVLPTITPDTGYTSVGWSTTSGDTTGNAAGSNYTLSNNSTIPTLYANAVAANYLNTTTNESYMTLKEAFNSVSNNQTIKVLIDTTETTQATLADTKTGIKLDLNGKTITSSASRAIENNGTLDIYNTSSTTGIIECSSTYTIYNTGTFTTNNTSSTNNIIIRNTSSSSGARDIYISTSGSATLKTNTNVTFTTSSTSANRYLIDIYGSLTIAGAILTNNITSTNYNNGIRLSNASATFTMTSGSISTFGSAIHNNTSVSSNAITISGGSITSTNYIGLSNAGGGTINIFDGTITGFNQGIQNNKTTGIINVIGGVITSTNNDGIYNSEGTVTISGGTITASKDGINNKSTVNITDGFITGSTRGIYNTGTATISGGTIVGTSSGITNYGTLTLGIKDSNVSTSSPIVQTTSTSNKYGVYIDTTGTFNFYDGIIKSSSGTGYSIYGTVSDTPDGYSVYKETVSGVESAYLVKQAILMNGTSGAATEVFLRTNIAKQDIEKITFTNSLSGHSANGTDCFDVSKDSDGSVLAWVTDTDSNGKYEVTIGALGKVYANSGYNLFKYLTNLTTITGWEYLDTSKVTDMDSMFSNCSSLTSVNLSNFNTSKVTDMRNMFSNCSGLTSINVKLSNFDTSKVKYMSNMFYGCSGLTSLDLTGSNFDTSQVTTMSGMFDGCTGLRSLNLKTSNFDTSAVTSMSYMFRNCTSLTSLDLTGTNFNTSIVTNMSYMFYGCTNLSSLNLSTLNTTSVTNMSYMFRNCTSLTSLDLTGTNFNTSLVTNMNYMFYGCTNLVTIYAEDNFDTSAVTSSSNMFYNNNSLVGGAGTVYTSSNPKDKTYAHLDEGTTNPGYFSNKKQRSAVFYYNSNTTSGSLTVSTAIETCTATSDTGSCTVTVPSVVSSSVGKYNSAYVGVSRSAGNLTSGSLTLTSSQTFYAFYRSNVTNYYYNTSYTNRTLRRTEFFTSNTTMDAKLSTSTTGTTNYTTAVGPNSSTWYGLSTAQDSTREYSTVQAAANSNSTTLYTVYSYNINFSKGANVSAIGSDSSHCEFTSSNTSCTVILPTITPNTGYISVGWNTTSGATTGTSAGQPYTVTTNTTVPTLYANAKEVDPNYLNTNTNTYYGTLNDAFSAVASNQTIKAMQNTTETTVATLADTKTGIKLDLNGKTITMDNTNISNSGTLDIYNTSGTTGTITGGASQVLYNKGTLTLNGTSSTNKIVIDITSNNTNCSAIHNSDSKSLIINNNVEIKASGSSAYGLSNKGTATITGGSITSTSGINNQSSGQLNISGSSTQITTTTLSGILNFGTTIISGGSITGSNYGISNSGTLTISGSSTQITSTSYSGISNTGTTTISGGTITGTVGIDNGVNQELNISGSSTQIIGTSSYGIDNNGIITMSAGTITGNSYGIRNKSGTANNSNFYGNVTITGGTIQSSNNHGIYVENEATLTLGTKDSTLSTSNPLVQTTGTSSYSGVYVYTGGIFNFYDGIIKSSSGTGYAISGTATEILDNYVIRKSTTNGIESATLGAAVHNYQNTTTSLYYETLNDAFSAVANNQTIKAVQNTTETAQATLASSKTGIKLDLNGKTITMDNTYIRNNGTLDIYNTSSTTGTINGGTTQVLDNYGTLTLNGTSSTNKIVINKTNNNSSYGAIYNGPSKSLTIYNNAELKVSSGTSNGIYNSGTATINGGTITSTGGGIYNYSSGQLNISGSTTQITGSSYGISNSGTATITGGTIQSSGYHAISVSNGATLTLGTKDSSVSSSSPIVQTTSSSNYYGVNIVSGGTFNFYDGIIKSSSGTGYSISGTVADTPTGYSVYKETTNGVEGAYLMGSYLNTSTNVSYTTLNDAFSAVSNNQTIKVMQNTTETALSTLASGKTGIKLELNGKTITLSSTRINNNGTLDIYNTSSATGTINGGTSDVLYNNGTLTLNGTSSTNKIVIEKTSNNTNGEVIYNNPSKSLTINNNVEVKVSAGSSDGIHNSGTATIIGGTIVGTSSGITNYGTLTLGTKDSNVSTSSPLVQTTGASNNYGVYVYSGETFNFYDGIVKSSSGTGYSIKGTVADIPDDYKVRKSTTDGIESATLGIMIHNYQNTSTNAYYETLYDAFKDVANNQTIKVMQNTTETTQATLASSKTGIKLDLNGKTITSSAIDGISNNGDLEINNTSSTIGIITGGTNSSVYNSGNINIIGAYTQISGSIYNSGTTTIDNSTVIDYSGNTIKNYGTLYVTGGTITSTGSLKYGIYNSGGTIYISGGTINGTYGIYDFNSGHIEISGSSTQIIGTTSGIRTTGTAIINGGTITGQSAGINNYPTGKLEIFGGTITGQSYGVWNHGIATISGGTITGTGTSSSGIYNSRIAGETNENSITITGGNITGVSNGLSAAGYSTVTLGIKDSSVSTSSPLVQTTGTSYNYGVTVSSGGIFNFYDGIIKSSSGTGYSIYGTVSDTPTGYVVQKTTSGGIETAKLVSSSKSGTNSSDSAGVETINKVSDGVLDGAKAIVNKIEELTSKE